MAVLLRGERVSAVVLVTTIHRNLLSGKMCARDELRIQAEAPGGCARDDVKKKSRIKRPNLLS